MHWKKISSYTNKNGKAFDIHYLDQPKVEGFDYYEFCIKVTNLDLKKKDEACEHIYKVIIKKEIISNSDDALNVLLGSPIYDIKKRLENVTDLNIPFYLPDFSFSGGYSII